MSKAIDAARRAAIRAEVQRRTWSIKPEVRAANADGSLPVSGHAAVFNTLSLPLYSWWEGRYVEQIAPGAFAKTLQECDCRMLINHDANLILARYRGNATEGNTLRLAEDNIGLLIDADMAPTTYAQDLALSMGRGDVTQMSFAFQVILDEWDETAEGTPRRTIREVKLFDVAPERRSALLGALLARTPIPTDLLPDLRAARSALDELAASAEPVDDHSERSVPADAGLRPLALMRRRHALVATRHGL